MPASTRSPRRAAATRSWRPRRRAASPGDRSRRQASRRASWPPAASPTSPWAPTWRCWPARPTRPSPRPGSPPVPDLRVPLAGVELKNPVICGAGERTMTAADLRAAIAAGAAAVVAKSVNESEAARAQLRASEYVAVDTAHVPVDRPGAGEPLSLHNRSGLADVDAGEWAALLAEIDAEAAAEDAYVIGSVVVADPGRAGETWAVFEQAGLRMVE